MNENINETKIKKDKTKKALRHEIAEMKVKKLEEELKLAKAKAKEEEQKLIAKNISSIINPITIILKENSKLLNLLNEETIKKDFLNEVKKLLKNLEK